ncbi:GNAT family N-acetyltransferase [Clostridium sp.]|uniref:GNAT family N-acetyltransferase n=1 Tax=Clostridium sp. TaxID=1506 RepID=UPI002FC9DA89
MEKIKNPSIKLKEKLGTNEYTEINNLQKICLEEDKTTLKLEIDYKLSRLQEEDKSISNINEFLYYDKDMLIGYIGICEFGRGIMEVNGMVHPGYRRRGVFKRLFSLVKDEWHKRESKKMFLLSDNDSVTGLEFIKSTGASHAHSEYEMFLKNDEHQRLIAKNVVLRKATNEDGREIAWQNSIYFNMKFNEADILMPEEEEKCGSYIYMAEVNNKIIGKVHLEISDGVGGIFGLGVLPEYRKKGYGREILVGAIEKLKEKGSKELMLQVEAKNSNALNLYKSCGFQETSTMNYYETRNL